MNNLYICAWFGLDKIIPNLFEKDVTINSPDLIYGQTPLMYACKNRKLSTVKTLLKLGADINRESERDSTALTEALQTSKVEIAEYLVTQPTLQISIKISSF